MKMSQGWGKLRTRESRHALSKTQPMLGTTPTFGEETEAVLLELGYEVEELDALRADGVIPPLG